MSALYYQYSYIQTEFVFFLRFFKMLIYIYSIYIYIYIQYIYTPHRHMLLWNYMFYLIFIERSTSTGMHNQFKRGNISQLLSLYIVHVTLLTLLTLLQDRERSIIIDLWLDANNRIERECGKKRRIRIQFVFCLLLFL